MPALRLQLLSDGRITRHVAVRGAVDAAIRQSRADDVNGSAPRSSCSLEANVLEGRGIYNSGNSSGGGRNSPPRCDTPCHGLAQLTCSGLGSA